MTIEALQRAIQKLIEKRKNLDLNDPYYLQEITRINEKLTKLYQTEYFYYNT